MIETLLAAGGWLRYDATFIDAAERAKLLQHFHDDIPWKQESGRFGPTPRLTAWYADDSTSYSYSGITHVGLTWTTPLLQLKSQIETATNTTFNSVLLNRYRDGRDSMGWHADDEPELGVNPVIASVSLGAVRRFRLKHPATKATLAIDLADGSLLVMGGTTQHHWQHSIPKTAQPVGERFNLTFRHTHPR